MGTPGTRLQQQASDRAHRDMHALAVDVVNDHEGTVSHIDLPHADEYHRHTVLHGNRLERNIPHTGLPARVASLWSADQHQPTAKGLGTPDTTSQGLDQAVW